MIKTGITQALFTKLWMRRTHKKYYSRRQIKLSSKATSPSHSNILEGGALWPLPEPQLCRFDRLVTYSLEHFPLLQNLHFDHYPVVDERWSFLHIIITYLSNSAINSSSNPQSRRLYREALHLFLGSHCTCALSRIECNWFNEWMFQVNQVTFHWLVWRLICIGVSWI